MKEFRHKNRELEFTAISGEVLGSEKYSETHVSSSGGGGYVSRSGGYVSAPSVQSVVLTNHEFWIKTESGLEKDIQLKGHDIPLRQGQKITLLSVGEKNSDSSWYAVLVNHSAQKYWILSTGHDLNKEIKLQMPSGISLLIAALSWAVIYFLTNSTMISTVLSLSYFFLNLIYKLVLSSNVEKAIDLHLEDLAKQALKWSPAHS